MDENIFVGCISCTKTDKLCDLFALKSENDNNYANVLEKCFNIKVKYLL